MSFRVWEYPRSGELLRAARLVEVSGLEPPSFDIEFLSRLGDPVNVFVTSGSLADPSSILYVEGHGTFEIEAVEPWTESRRFLTLRPWPRGG